MLYGKENVQPTLVVYRRWAALASSSKTAQDRAQQRDQHSPAPAPFAFDPDNYEVREVHGVHAPLGGWFFQCRGCQWMTTHEFEAEGYTIPLCGRCQRQLTRSPDVTPVLLPQLIEIHKTWVKAGL